jgi:integrase
MDEFVTFKKSRGLDYGSSSSALRQLDRFLLRSGYERQDFTAEILEQYVASTRHLAARTRYGNLAEARRFARWLRRLVPASAVIEDIPVKRPTLPRHYLYSRAEIVSIIQAARRMKIGAGTILPLCRATLFGMLYATGLRINEALALDMGDIDLTAGRLTVRKGKLGKARNIALSGSTATAVGRYLDARNRVAPAGRDTPVFINSKGWRLSYSGAHDAFKAVRALSGVGAGAAHAPRLHDFRHTYACDCLRKWYEEGVDVNAKLPILSTAMGHASIHDTQIYLHVTAQLLQTAAGRFHGTFKNNIQGTLQ